MDQNKKDWITASEFRGFESSSDRINYDYVKPQIIEAMEMGCHSKRLDPVSSGIVDAVIQDLRLRGFWIKYKEYRLRLPLGGSRDFGEFIWDVRKPRFAWFRGYYSPKTSV